jgi:hypothetical protein
LITVFENDFYFHVERHENDSGGDSRMSVVRATKMTAEVDLEEGLDPGSQTS